MSAALLLSAFLLTVPVKSEEAKAERNYSFDFAGTTKELKKGSGGDLVVKIQPKEGYKISSEAPLKIELSSKGLELKKRALGRDDAEDKKSPAPKLRTSFTGGADGQQQIEGKAHFFVCNDELCERKNERFTVVVNVQP